MSLQTAIMALTPALYWRLSEPFGATSVADSAGGAFAGTVSGDIGLGTFGPEIDRTSARIFTGGQIVSPSWGSTVWSAFSVMFAFSAPFDGTAGSLLPIIGLGDPASPASKFRIAMTSTSVNVGSWIMVPGSGTQAGSATIAQPVQNWHHITFVYSTAPSKTMYLDGAPGTPSATTLTPAPVAGDRWFIQSTVPIIVSDLAVFTRALTQIEIQTVSNQFQKWYAQVPINSPVPIEGGQIVVNPPATDLTPVLTQTTQILNNQAVTDPIVITDVPQILSTTNTIHTQTTVIHDDTQNIVNTLFPQLGTVLNDIGAQINDVQDAVRGTVKQGADWLTKTVGELLSRGNAADLNYASLSGGPTCSPIEVDVSGNHLYGIRLEITEYPPDWRFRTPDSAWSLKDLAVIRVYRGGKLEARQGVHTIVHTWEPIPQPGYPWLGIFPPVQTAGTVITVDFAPGVCGNLIGEEFPS